MSKDSDPSKWKMAPHTKAKHQILENYLGAWFPILSRWRGRVLYIDGFAGRGRYDDGSEGSPQIALRRLRTHHFLPKMSGCEFVFVFIEKDIDNCASLEQELERLKIELAPWPDNIKTHVINGSFDNEMNRLIEAVREQNRKLAPTFAFIDPFGYTRFPMDLLKGIAETERSELFINFMVGFVQRFITRDHQEAPIQALYGMEVDEVLAEYEENHDRIGHLVEVYAKSLAKNTKLEHIQKFYMLNRTGNVSYALIHATNSPVGVQRMKAAMWKIDPGGNYKFSDRMDGQGTLFEQTPDLRPLKQAIVNEYVGRSGISADEVKEFAVLCTPYRETHVTPILKEMEKAGEIIVFRPNGKRQFSAGVTFSLPSS
ncbi:MULTISPECIES: three-Cys-motif partner protein TcmP [Rhodococcus]|uniref:three-Cys-motif partner protein TcmP n=1 Tax=Rhodococcus TaxID=1827 RepID=UPI00143EC022|nr:MULTISPECIES: three-Cys-motif partner protein TcmP [Rhodococcus]QIX48959.1 three-Cys-motif partner protein TcmP [Rhodococcus sp. DMU1]QRI75990.1 three-Cys-motif partner protein TcmP [Rhodococcus aetherivorans]QSE59401.1 three-Cys-motif partner protein TcmP [Rhodococcus sp. PSBB066]QSE69274.1 three-Cys-motif partner protein TcmP [Rhodococcus sp. PSBB049]